MVLWSQVRLLPGAPRCQSRSALTPLRSVASTEAARSVEGGEEVVHDRPERLALVVGVVDEVVGSGQGVGGDVRALFREAGQVVGRRDGVGHRGVGGDGDDGAFDRL